MVLTCTTSKTNTWEDVQGNLHPCTSISNWIEKIACGLLIFVTLSFLIYCILRARSQGRHHALGLANVAIRPDAGPSALIIDTDRELSNGFKDGDDKSDGKAENVLLVIHPGELKLHYIAWPISSQTTKKEQGYDTEAGEAEELATEGEDKSGDVNSREFLNRSL